MEEIALPSKECKGIDLPDAIGNPSGKVIRARRPGYVEIDNPRVARMIRSSTGQRFNRTIGIDGRNDPGWRCECGRENWSWTPACGKCGAQHPEELLAA